ncbi:MAG: AAA family ATPase [Ktedonobacteraceae bacterium]
MRVVELAIDKFKNLTNFSIDFDAEALTTVVLGRNGTGKSNLLEALIIIFQGLDLGTIPAFKYRMTYLCRDTEVTIDADPERSGREQVRIKVDGEPLSYQQFSKQTGRRYLPSYVFGYYSGPSNRMETHFDAHQKRFYDELLKGEDRPLRPLLYARLVHSQFALLSFFNEQDPGILHFLTEHLGIERLDSVLFVMRKPSWTSKAGDPRFWNARGVVKDFLDRLYELALVPLRLPRRVHLDFKQSTNLEHLYLYLKDVDDLKALAAMYNSQQEFFKALESTYISEILSEVRIRLQIRNADGTLTFRDLSEGEQQLLMVLGLLRFTKEDEALFLLDEPDTHLNPAWGIQYLEFIRLVVGELPKSQILMATHNPLVISSLERLEVRIMRRDDESGQVYSVIPEESPRGMGIAGILTSDLFGLRSTLDIPTQRLVDERRELAAQDDLTSQQRARLRDLNQQLEGLDFSITTLPDPLYHDFVNAMTRHEDPAIRDSVTLTPEQRASQKALTQQILQELKQEERQQE